MIECLSVFGVKELAVCTELLKCLFFYAVSLDPSLTKNSPMRSTQLTWKYNFRQTNSKRKLLFSLAFLKCRELVLSLK